ncbi:NPCBM/NEW2 domain-containing protein [Nocardiopsis sp. CC223A]|uniref:NPCBM/NEW2 domain-containing protein n=1 Tax=Nocardiopsis sp. CC223A TaxID=3044051 RepID=UPI00278BCBA5|nr:NPCBM/NEW2 domain-containing protein [Nocardiopsis sp. CC223A]
MSKSLFLTLVISIVALIGFGLYVLWVGGGITRDFAWEFASWVGGALGAIVLAVAGCITIFMRIARKKDDDDVAWARQPFARTRGYLVAVIAVTAFFSTIIGGGVGYGGALMRQDREEQRSANVSASPEPTATPSPDNTEGDRADGLPEPPTTGPPTSPEDPPSPEQTPQDGENGPERWGLSRLTVAESGHHYDTGAATVDGLTHTETVQLKSCAKCAVEFDLGRDWKTFEAVVGLSDDSPSGSSVTVRVFADDDLLDSHTLGLGETGEVSVSVENALRLRLEVERLEDSGWTAVWAAPTVSR